MAANGPLIEAQSFVSKALTTLIMLVAFGGLAVLGWYANEEKRLPDDYTNLPVIKAQTEPFKIKPTDPGGMNIPHGNIQIYDEITTNMKSGRTDVVDLSDAKLTPPPEEPVKLPETQQVEIKSMEKTQPSRLVKLKEEVSVATAEPIKAKPFTLDTQAIKAAITNTKPTENVTQTKIIPVRKPEATVAVTSKSKRIKATKTASYDPRYTRIILSGIPKRPQTAAEATPATMAKPAQIVSVPKIKRMTKTQKVSAPIPTLHLGGVLIQLGSFKSRANVKDGWMQLKKRFPKELSTLSLSIKTADLGPQGVFYRMLAGPFSNDDNAAKACKRLTSKGQACLVAR